MHAHLRLSTAAGGWPTGP